MAELWQLGLGEIVSLTRSGRLSPLELIESLIERSDRLESDLRAWVTLDREGARRAAGGIADQVRKGGDPGPLAGVPVGLKDIFYTAGLRTTAGSPLLADFVPDYDATSVKRLRERGAIVLGKLQTTEFASADPSPARNPWNLEHTPGGSSSGSAVAVAAGMLPVALGSQTGGSTLRPASYNGIVGLKPTYGLISCYGVVANAWSFDTVGILARSVEDAALTLEATAGFDLRDPASIRTARFEAARALEAPARAPRIGLVRDYFLEECSPEVAGHTESIARQLAGAGAEVDEVPLPDSFRRVHDEHRTIADAELATVHQERFERHPDQYGPKIGARIRSGLSMPATDWIRAARERPEIVAELRRVVGRVDVLLTPTAPAPAPRDLNTTGDPSFQVPWSYCGFPAISLPSGLSTSGLPLGIQLVAGPRRDTQLLQVARWCEGHLAFAERPACWPAATAMV